jgi:poly(A) RNA polymerase GLD2
VSGDARFPKLVLVAKTWAKENGINNAYQKTLSSYTLTLMVIHVLQTCKPPVLPCLQVERAEDFAADGDYTMYTLTGCLADFKSQNTQTLGELFVCFLRYFSEEFDYDRSAISVRLGRIVAKSTVRSFRSSKNNACQWNFVAVEEPFDRTNAASAVHDPIAFQKILAVFRMSYRLISNHCAFGFVSPLRKSPPPAPTTAHVCPMIPVPQVWGPAVCLNK